MITNKRLERFSATYPYIVLNIFFALPAGIPYTTFEKIAMPFSTGVWIAIFCICILAIVVLSLIKKITFINWRFDSNSALILSVINTFLGGTTTETPNRNYAKFGLIVWLLTTFIIRNAYLGSMFNYLQAQIHSMPVDTIDKVTQFNYTIYAEPSLYKVLYDSEPNLRKQFSILQQFHSLLFLIQLSHCLQLAIGK